MCSRPDVDFFYAPFGVCGNPANVLWNQRSEAADLSHHRTAFYGINPNGRAIDTGYRWLQARDCDRSQDQPKRGSSDDNDPALAFFSSDTGARYVHRGKIWRKPGRPDNPWVCWFSVWNHGIVRVKTVGEREGVEPLQTCRP